MPKLLAPNGKLVCRGDRGNAMQFIFDTSSQVRIPAHAAATYSTNFTLEFWIFPQDNPAARRRMDVVVAGGFTLYVAEYGAPPAGFVGRLDIYNYATGNTSLGVFLRNNAWAHVAVTMDANLPANNVKFYVNGELQALATDGAYPASGGSQTFIAASPTDGSRRLRGQLDELRLWNVTRTAAQIQANYLNRTLADTAGLVGWYAFDEAAGNALDQGPLANHAPLGSAGNVPTCFRVGSTAPLTPAPPTKQLTI